MAPEIAAKLVSIAERARNLKGHGLDEGISTRMLVYAGSLIAYGVEPLAACRVAPVRPITDDMDMRDATAIIWSSITLSGSLKYCQCSI